MAYDKFKVNRWDELEVAYNKMNQALDELQEDLSKSPSSHKAIFSVAPPTVGEMEDLNITVGKLKNIQLDLRKIIGI